MQQGFTVKYFHDQVEKSPGKYFFTLYKLTIGEIPNLFLHSLCACTEFYQFAEERRNYLKMWNSVNL